MANTSSQAAFVCSHRDVLLNAPFVAVAVGLSTESMAAMSDPNGTTEGQKVALPTLVMHSEDDQVVPHADSGPLSAKLLKNGTLKSYKGFPHGIPTTEAETINADWLAFLRG